MKRRQFLRFSGLSVTGSALASPHFGAETVAALERMREPQRAVDATTDARDEAFWRGIRSLYAPPTDYLDLDHANTSPTSAPVFDAFLRRARFLSHAPAERFNTMWSATEVDVRPMLAMLLATDVKQFAIVGNATIALNTVIHGFPLERGDEIIVTNHEYPDMMASLQQRERRDGVIVRTVQVPSAAENRLALVDRVANAITPRTRLVLLSHVSAWSGEILPVAEVTATARARGVAVLVDAAQSVGMLDVSFTQIGCDFLAASFHKWLGAPLSSGILVMRKEHVGKVWPLHPPSWDITAHPMDQYEWSGSINMAAPASIGDAIQFQRKLGAERKRQRMRFLGDYWQSLLRAEPRVRILTPSDPARSFGVASMFIEGVPSDALTRHLRLKARISVQDKAGPHSPFPNAIRVSPAPYTTPAELDRFVDAVRSVAIKGLTPSR